MEDGIIRNVPHSSIPIPLLTKSSFLFPSPLPWTLLSVTLHGCISYYLRYRVLYSCIDPTLLRPVVIKHPMTKYLAAKKMESSRRSIIWERFFSPSWRRSASPRNLLRFAALLHMRPNERFYNDDKASSSDFLLFDPSSISPDLLLANVSAHSALLLSIIDKIPWLYVKHYFIFSFCCKRSLRTGQPFLLLYNCIRLWTLASIDFRS